MSFTRYDIFNQALALLGNTRSIASEMDNSVEAVLFDRFYNLTRQSLLSSYPWSFAVKQDDLTEVTDETNEEFSVVYEYPSDCLRMLRILGSVGEPIAFRVIYTLDGATEVRRIVCDEADAVAEYIMDIDDTNLYPAPFVEALGAQLATKLSMPLNSNADVVKFANQSAFITIEQAKKLFAMEGTPVKAKVNRYIEARG